MRKSILLFIMFLLFSLSSFRYPATAAGKPVHLFILSGQSNMARMDPEKCFMPEAKKLFKDGEVLFVKVAKGGRPIRLWVKEWNEIAKKHKLTVTIKKTEYYQPILDQVKEVLKDRKPASVTFCWMQGERDAKEKLDAAYKDAMMQLIKNLRRDLKQPKMYFVVGRLSDCLKNAPWEAIRKVQVEVATEDPHGAWVDTDDLNDIEKKGKMKNDLHYSKEGYLLFGQRLARQAKALIDGKKPAEDGRPVEEGTGKKVKK